MYIQVKSVQDLADNSSWKVKEHYPKSGKILCTLSGIPGGEHQQVWADKSLRDLLETNNAFKKVGRKLSESRNWISALTPLDEKPLVCEVKPTTTLPINNSVLATTAVKATNIATPNAFQKVSTGPSVIQRSDEERRRIAAVTKQLSAGYSKYSGPQQWGSPI